MVLCNNQIRETKTLNKRSVCMKGLYKNAIRAVNAIEAKTEDDVRRFLTKTGPIYENILSVKKHVGTTAIRSFNRSFAHIIEPMFKIKVGKTDGILEPIEGMSYDLSKS